MKPCAKKSHPTREAAQVHMAELIAADASPKPRRLRTYWCPYHKAFHVGHAGNRGKGSRERASLKRNESKYAEERRLLDAFMAGKQFCELTPLLYDFQAPGWDCFVWNVYPERKPLEPHHIFGRKFKNPHVAWNLIAITPNAHEYCTGATIRIRTDDERRVHAGSSKIGRALCCLAKARLGEIDFQIASEAVGFDVLGSLEVEVEQHCYRGVPLLEEAVRQLVTTGRAT